MDTMKAKEKIVPDTSIIISGVLAQGINKKEIQNVEVIIPEFVLEELRAQASKGREIGFRGLEEIKQLREFEKKGIISIRKTERRQTMEEIQLAKYGRIDALIMDIAKQENAVLYTADMVQALTAEAEGVRVRYFKQYEKKEEIQIKKMLTEDTMSLHLKEDTYPLAKRGKPGQMKLVRIREEKIGKDELESIIKEIMDAVRYEDDSFIEIGGHAASVVQMGDMRIAIARQPFSDGLEVTVVRPIAKLTLDDYRISEKLKDRLRKNAEGVIIAGPPGSGKSTFAASLAEFYEKHGNIVKTLESPRDLQVGKEITQYSKLRGSFENTADLLLLVRPDYSIFDEVRKTEEFEIFSDMRLAGIGMIGVVHASNPIDAVQRFMGRLELGMIPHVMDTIIFIKDGTIKKVFYLSLTVRPPTGMIEADLARPIVEVKDFETNALEYEIYTYGEENVIIPVKPKQESAVLRLAKQQILNEVRRYDSKADVELIDENNFILRVENDVIPVVIGRNGSNVKMLEEKLGMRIEVAPKVSTMRKEIRYEKSETGAYMVFSFAAKPGEVVNFYVNDEYLFSATLGKNSQVRVAKTSDHGKKMMRAVLKNTLKVFI